MFSRKRWLVILAVITTVLLLGACGSKDTAGDNPVSNNGGPQDGSPNNILSLSESLEKYHVWFGSNGDELSRETPVKIVFEFENGSVKYYDYGFRGEFLTIEDIVDMSDKEIVKHAQENAEEINLDKYSLDIILDDTGNNTEKEQLLPQEGEKKVIFNGGITKEFFGTYFSGMTMDSLPIGESNRFGFLLTRTDDSAISFKLDNPDTDKKNVTIEGK